MEFLTEILALATKLAHNKLNDKELAYLFKHLSNSTTDLAKVNECLKACLNNNTKLLYLRELSKESIFGIFLRFVSAISYLQLTHWIFTYFCTFLSCFLSLNPS